jgi:hypothetical protein
MRVSCPTSLSFRQDTERFIIHACHRSVSSSGGRTTRLLRRYLAVSTAGLGRKSNGAIACDGTPWMNPLEHCGRLILSLLVPSVSVVLQSSRSGAMCAIMSGVVKESGPDYSASLLIATTQIPFLHVPPRHPS